MSHDRPQSHCSPAATIVAALLLTAAPALGAAATNGGIDSPHLRLSAPAPLAAEFTGPADLQAAMGSAEPRSLASADFDEDGMPDLVTGYKSGTSGLGVVALWRGNVDAVYPYTEEAKARKVAGTFVGDPFLGPARLTPVPERVDFVSAGDFDADGHFDLLTGARGGSAIHFLAGDGTGRFEHVRSIELDGALTAWTSGEVNRRDGLADLAVAIEGAEGFEALVFEHPKGAVRAEPERFALPARATDLLLASLDLDYYRDLAIAAGNRVVLVGGRDRKLVRPEEDRAEVPSAVVFSLERPEPVLALARGDFAAATVGPELALLDASGKVSYLALDLGESPTDGSGNGEADVAGAASPWSERFTVDLTHSDREAVALAAGALSGATRPPSLHAATTSSLGAQTLLVVAPAAAGPQLVTAPAAGKGSPVAPTGPDRRSLAVEAAVAALPMRLNPDAMTDLVVVSASEPSPSFAASMSGATYTVGDDGDTSDNNLTDLVCDDGAGNCTLRAAIEQANFTVGADAIHFDIAVPFGNPIISPAFALPDITDPVSILGSSDPSGGVIVEGSSHSGRGLVIDPDADGSMLEGLTIAAHGDTAVSVYADDCVIEGNVIGKPSATALFAGNGGGVKLSPAPFATEAAARNTIGGTTVAARNIISGNQGGVSIDGTCVGECQNRVIGNYISVDESGNERLPFSPTVVGSSVNLRSVGNDLGEPTAGGGNLIGSTVIFAAQASGLFQEATNMAQNLVGLKAGGAALLDGAAAPDRGLVVDFDTSLNLIGGATTMHRNTFAGFASSVVLVEGGVSNQLDGNTFQNSPLGIDVDPDSLKEVNELTVSSNTITAVADHGILIRRNTGDVKQMLIADNDIFGSNFDGVHLASGGPITTFRQVTVRNNQLGPTGLAGIGVMTFGDNVQVTIQENSISGNGKIGISLGNIDSAPIGNDTGDGDTGPNGLQNHPLVGSAVANSGVTMISGQFNSKASQTYTLDFYRSAECDPSGYGEGEIHYAALSVTTNNAGNAQFGNTFPNEIPAATPWVTATATNADGQTSEFSPCRKVSNYAAGCTDPENIVLDYQHENSNLDYRACESIAGSAPVIGDSDLLLTAPLIVFEDGFEVRDSSAVEAGN